MIAESKNNLKTRIILKLKFLKLVVVVHSVVLVWQSLEYLK